MLLSFTSLFSIFLSDFLSPSLCLFPSSPSSCYAFGSDIAKSIPTYRCISSISSFCFVKQQFNQCLLFPTYGLVKSWQLPSLLVREAEECRIEPSFASKKKCMRSSACVSVRAVKCSHTRGTVKKNGTNSFLI